MRVTEQGEMIRFKYGSPPLALINLDLVLSAAIEASLLPPPQPRENWRLLMQRLSEVACESYRSTVQSNKDFIDYFADGTPERELALLALGSRPARRSGGDTDRSISELRAIPWVFAWTQKRLMLPAWLGTDTAFEQELSSKELNVLKEMVEEWPFFQTQINMLEMVLCKADAEISERYDETLVSPKLKLMGDSFRSRLAKLIDSINRLKNQDILLEGNPEIRQTLDLRHPYTDPLHLLQIELIKRCREESGDMAQAHKALLVTIAGIAASMRNTG
jgi:phosphoenolpyruvate carboxylase